MEHSSGGETPASTRTVPTVQLLLLNAAVFAVELSATSVFTYIPPMLLKAGFEEKHMSWVIGAGPFICLLAVPAIGAASDRCTSRYGKRLPFILVICSGVVFSLLMIPYLDHVATGREGPSQRAAAFALALFVVLLDFCNQACLTPCEAFLSDVTRGTTVRDRAFSFYSLLSSLGGCVGYAITAIDWEHTPVGAMFGDQDHCVFSLIAIVFVLAVVATVRTAMGFTLRDSSPSHSASSFAADSHISASLSSESSMDISSSSVLVADDDSTLVRQRGLPPPRSRAFRFCVRLLPRALLEFVRVPLVLRRLVCANFCAWAAVMTFLLFYTDFIGEVVYGGSPRASTGSPLRIAFDEGVRAGSGGLLLHAAASAVSAAAMERILGWFPLRTIYLGALAIFGVTVAIMAVVRNIIALNALAAVTGIAFAALTTVPFSLIGIYHECKEVYFLDVPAANRLTRGIGSDMATMDTAYFSSQVLLLSFMGFIVHTVGSAVTYMVTAAVMSVFACFFISRLVYSKAQMVSLMEKSYAASS